MNLMNSPFSEHSHILDLAIAGAIDGYDLSTYYKLMDLYKSYLSKKITFFDISKYGSAEHIQLQNLIFDENKRLDLILNEEIKRLEENIKME